MAVGGKSPDIYTIHIQRLRRRFAGKSNSDVPVGQFQGTTWSWFSCSEKGESNALQIGEPLRFCKILSFMDIKGS